MSGKAPREKGARLERLIVDILNSYGIEAKRVPLSGAAIGFKGDIHATVNGQQLQLEAKSRRKGFAFIYDALEGNDGLVVKTDRSDPLIVMPLRRLARLIGSTFEASHPTTQASHNPSLPFQFNPKGRVRIPHEPIGSGFDMLDTKPSMRNRED